MTRIAVRGCLQETNIFAMPLAKAAILAYGGNRTEKLSRLPNKQQQTVRG
jgi:hypothetical protein